MAEIASPASDPRFLRRHYPHQVQGVRSAFADHLSQAAPPHWIENKTTGSEVNWSTTFVVS